MSDYLVDIKHEKLSFFTPAGEVKALNDVSIRMKEGEVLGIVGESGSGKSVTAYSLMGLTADNGKIIGGEINFNGHRIDQMTENEIRAIRGKEISIIFQDPMTSLNPVYTIGNQIEEAVRTHGNKTKAEAKDRARELLTLVGINEPDKRLKQYPHELSGGMRQRIMIAIALACEPKLLIADEPTTALDVTIQAQILELMNELKDKLGMGIILITHDLGVVASMCDNVAVMYAGEIVEYGTVDDIFYNPRHEYTKGLLKSIPKFQEKEYSKLVPIEGQPVDLLNPPKGCPFAPRCDSCMKICLERKPEATQFEGEHSWKRVADPNTAAPYGYDLLNYIKGYDEASEGNLDALAVSAPDTNTFVVELKSPCVYFDKICAFAVMVPVQKATIESNGESWTTKPETYITDGPYYMTEYTDGAQIVFTKNPNYWDAANITFDTITWHLIEDPNASYSAYQNGELDMIKDVPTEEIPSLEGNEEFHIEPIMGTYYITFNTQRAPFDNVKVREALSLAIDRAYVADTIMQGTYTPAKNFVGPGVSDEADGSSFEEVTTGEYGDHFDVTNYEADLEKAKSLLAEAGYPDGAGFPEIAYLTNDAGYHKAVAEYLQGAWGELGITMTINIQEWKTVTADRRAGNFDVARNGWVYDWDDPSNMINLLETGNGNNDGKYSNPDFDKAVDDARNTTDLSEHYKKLHEAEQIALNDAAMAPIAYYNDFYLQKTNLNGTWHSPYGYWYFMYGSK